MSELMRPIPIKNLVEWALEEFNKEGSVFGIRKEKFYKNKSKTHIEMFGDKISSLVGPAAGPNSQLAQNIIAAYFAGARFVELKTVQALDGAELRKFIPRPCINAEDEAYNVEWSTEFTAEEAMNEYIKAWVAIHVLAKELDISDERDFVFNMSVGYDLDGIKSEKITNFLYGLKDASRTAIWAECIKYLENNADKFSKFKKADIKKIDTAVAPSITLSTLHGCPPAEIERISNYLLTEVGIHTYIKCNPTILGYDLVRNLLDKMGYGYISFTRHHFEHDLQLEDAKVMLKRLMELAKSKKLDFGVKITNTFPVKIENKELPGQEMYMSGRPLYPLSVTVAKILSEEFKGQLPISYSGGADFFNIERLASVGIQPITVATTILKPGGYERFSQLAKLTEPILKGKFKGIDVAGLIKLADSVSTDARHIKSARPVGSLKTDSKLNLFDCFISPCKDAGCPINQQIPEYVNLVEAGKYDEAFKIIAIDNALPSVTGTICDHQCQYKCVRNDYESSVKIRASKKAAVSRAQDNFIKNIKPVDLRTDKKVVVIGAGPAGIAAGLFLRRNGVDVTVLEKREKPYGIVEYAIPNFRLEAKDLDRDYQMAVKAGVNFKFNVDKNYSVEKLKKDYNYVILATGAWKEGHSPVKTGGDKVIDALAFLQDFNMNDGKVKLGEKVAVIGGGDVAMDCVRAAKKVAGVKEAVIVYRRTEEFMPANPEEIKHAKDDKIKFKELLAPVSFDGKKLTVEMQMLTDERDASGRKMIKGTGKMKELDYDTVIGAVGARVDTALFEKNKLAIANGYPKVNQRLETSINDVYIAGDCKEGAATIVKAIADAKVITKDILRKVGLNHDFVRVENKIAEKELYARKGVLKDEATKGRCLTCDQICEICTDVCPNRANTSIIINAPEFRLSHQILHIDGMCNECGNCGVFCPHRGNPYKDKVTLFWTREDFFDSTNVGFIKGEAAGTFEVRTESGKIVKYALGGNNISHELKVVIDTVINDYPYYLVEL